MDSFLHVTTERIEKHTHIKTKSKKTLTLNDEPWISWAVKKSIKIRNNIYTQTIL